MAEFINCAGTAKLIRAQLKGKFPGIKFSVRSSVYAGGASIDVSWIDGPAQKLVDAVVGPFAGAGFDGMIDMQYNVTAFLLPDGSAVFAQTEGTQGAGGVYEAGKAFMPEPGAKRVSFGADYVFTKREYSRGFLERALISFQAKYGADAAAGMVIKDGFSGAYMSLNGMSWELEQRWYSMVAKRVAGNVKMAA